jgi:hypothetical protein
MKTKEITKMKHVKQEYCECSLAVTAMVSGADYSEVQNYAWERFPSRRGLGYRCYQVAEIWATFGLGDYLEEKQYHDAPWTDLAHLTLKGRGHLLFTTPTMRLWHHVAYESGMIYDGKEERPRRLWNWAVERPFVRRGNTMCQVLQVPINAANKGVK